jgi:hypothetical protein
MPKILLIPQLFSFEVKFAISEIRISKSDPSKKSDSSLPAHQDQPNQQILLPNKGFTLYTNRISFLKSYF